MSFLSQSNLSPSNRLVELARSAQRVPHILLALLMSVLFIQVGVIPSAVLVQLGLRALFPGGRDSLADQPFLLTAISSIQLIAAFGAVFFWVWLWLKWFERRPFWTLGFERAAAVSRYARGFGFGCAAFAVSIAVPAAFGLFTLQQVHVAALGGVIVALAGWVVQAAAEEVLIRGWLMNVIAARSRLWIGVLLSALVFTALHLGNDGIALLPVLNLFLFGLFASLYALWEGSLWGVVAWHTAWNWAQGNLFGLHVSGSSTSLALLQMQAAPGSDLWTGGAFGPEGGLAVTLVLLLSIAIVGYRYQRRAASAPSPTTAEFSV